MNEVWSVECESGRIGASDGSQVVLSTSHVEAGGSHMHVKWLTTYVVMRGAPGRSWPMGQGNPIILPKCASEMEPGCSWKETHKYAHTET